MNKNYKIWRTETSLWKKLKPIAREMRGKPTEAEDLLWQKLRRYNLHGYKFRRQHNIERFIVDFYCAKANLVIEVDGPIHQYQVEEDSIRQEYLESQNLKILRFSNEDILKNVNVVIKQILSFLA